jgi:hypothetical protein
MGIEFKLSDRELPASPAFIRFLAHTLSGSGRAADQQGWPDQISETLWRADSEYHRGAIEAAERVMSDAKGRALVARAYALLVALLTGDLPPLESFQSRFHFIVVVGIPRTGGSYLTAEIYRSLQIAPHEVPSALAHDSFPEAQPFDLTAGTNSWITTLKTTAEYLTMVEVFFADRKTHGGKIVVPKKLTQGVYAARLFQRILGPQADCVLTVRHPASACVSTYEKSGGLPNSGRFIVRSNIEAWCRRDLERTTRSINLEELDYFDAYLRYWEHYHLQVITNGLSHTTRLRVVAYGAEALQALARHYHDLHRSALRASVFQVSDTVIRRHPEWIARARPVIERVAAAWRQAGLEFPTDAIAEAV